jgi:hypothetical protein
MSDENEGILGNLPRSRPGVRSDKRGSGGKAAAGAATPTPKPGGRTKSQTGAAGGSRAARPRAARARAAERASPPPAERSSDPIGFAVSAGETVARTGVKVAARVAGGVLRRLRP